MVQLSNWRFWMALCALGIIIFGILFTNRLAKNIAHEEATRIRTYAAAVESAAKSSLTQDISFQLEMIASNKSIPVVLTDESGNVIDHRNLSASDSNGQVQMSKPALQSVIADFKKLHAPIRVELPQPQYVYYGESTVLKQLRFFPYVLFGIIIVFISIVLIAYANAAKSMQNRLWVGMSKETAHQLGTPLMSMVGWLEVLKGNGQEQIATEMEKDVDRLQLIANRFSKIGSTPQLQEENIVTRLQNMVDYMRRRSAKNVSIVLNTNQLNEVPIALNGPLFDWVIENLIRNSLDAMQGQGAINIELENKPTEIIIDVSDTGKGIPEKEHRKIFKPGYTTKQRGWGLGLSLAKRIVTKYHHGSIVVLRSAPGQGTTFRIVLKR